MPKSVEERIAVSTDRLEKKFELVKNLAGYIADHSMLLDDNAANDILSCLLKYLNEFCEACGGAMCDDEHCPVALYGRDVKRAINEGK